jgi:hypothetical protein
VRRFHGEPGPRGAERRFEGHDKVAWDIGPWQEGGPVPVRELVVLTRPGGDRPERRRLSTAEAVRALAGHTAWLRDPAEGAERLFGPTVAFAGRVPVVRTRLPRQDAWVEQLQELLEEAH